MNFMNYRFPIDFAALAASYDFDASAFTALDKHMEAKLAAYDPDFGPYLVGHLQRTARDTEQFMLRLGYDADIAKKVGHAVGKHDAGKILQPTEYWHLTAEKRKLPPEIKQDRPNHTTLGLLVLDNSIAELGMELTEHMAAHVDLIKSTMLYHHERLDASGPKSLVASDMDPVLRIITIVDTVDGKAKAKTLSEIFEDMNGSKHAGQFDAELVRAYESYCKESPVFMPTPALAKQEHTL